MSVTVMIPAYNAETTIRRAIDSVLNQTRPPEEVVVVDDGSKDGTRDVVASYGSRVRLMTQTNQGPSIARNRSVQTMSTDYVAFVDADDAWHPKKIELQLAAFAATPGAVLCYTGIRAIEPNGAEHVYPAVPLEKVPALIRYHNPGIPPSSMMVPRETYLRVGGFNPALRGIDDWEFVLRMTRTGPLCSVDEPLLLYYINDAGLSNNFGRIFEEVTKMTDTALLEGLTGVERWVWRRRILSYQSYKVALTARSKGHPDELRYMRDSILTWPSPLWQPTRFKAMAVTLRNALRNRNTAPQTAAAKQ